MDLNYENSGDDDSFYAELRKQILLLTTDDEDEEEEDRYDDFINDQRNKISRFTKRSAAKSPGRYYDWTENDKTNNSVPNWILNLWRTGNINGTGVFIPDINVKSRRRNNKPSKCFSLLSFFYGKFSNVLRLTLLYIYIPNGYCRKEEEGDKGRMYKPVPN